VRLPSSMLAMRCFAACRLRIEVCSLHPLKSPRLPFSSPLPRKQTKVKSEKYGTGAVSEYALLAETLVVSKPRNLNFIEAASIPMVALTALQMLDKVPGGVQGKTVFIPAGRKCFPFFSWPET